MTQIQDEVRSYLNRIGQVPLLKAVEEIELGKQVKKMMTCLEIKEQLLLERSLVKDEEWAGHLGITVEELHLILKKGERAKEKMVKANLRLVVAMAKKHQGKGLELLDLVQEGNLGLIKAVEKFEFDKGYKFSTYAYHWIRQAITRAIFEKGRTIRLPVHINEEMRKLRKVQFVLRQELGRSATVGELSEKLELTPEKIRLLRELKNPIVSLDKQALKEEENSTLLNFLADPNSNLAEFLEEVANQELVEKLLGGLQPREQIVIREYYLETPSLSLNQIGQKMKVTRERVRQIKTRAVQKLRTYVTYYLTNESSIAAVEDSSKSSQKSVKLKEVVKASPKVSREINQSEESSYHLKRETEVVSPELKEDLFEPTHSSSKYVETKTQENFSKSVNLETEVNLSSETVETKTEIVVDERTLETREKVKASPVVNQPKSKKKTSSKSRKTQTKAKNSSLSRKTQTKLKQQQAEVKNQLRKLCYQKSDKRR